MPGAIRLLNLTDQLQVIGETNDMVRVMNYDMYIPATPRTDLTARPDRYYAGGRGAMANSSRPDCYGMGPTSTAPWAAMGMQWWLGQVPTHKLVMGIPAYSNDYPAAAGGGPGYQAG